MSSTSDNTSALAEGAERLEENSSLAFLPNLLPTYRTDDGVGMFSLFYSEPKVDQGWRVMLRGLHLPKLLVCQKSIEFLEKCADLGGVEWKPLPPNDNRGSSGIIFNAQAFETANALETAMNTLTLEDKEKSGSEDSGGEGDTDTEPVTPTDSEGTESE